MFFWVNCASVEKRTSSLTSIKEEQLWIYISRRIASGIIAMLWMISRIVSAFRIGSFLPSSASSFALNWIKSTVLFSKNCLTSVSWWFLTKLSGSSPSGNVQMETCIPASRMISTPRMAARRPAASPSNNKVMLSVNRRIKRTWSGVNAVPEEETTFWIPAWCIWITSVYPSTR
jgi:hypothetical protein